MNKRRVTLNLDADVADALRTVGGDSMSAVANEALREALESAAHRAALSAWIDELNAKHGAPTQQQLDEADEFLDAVERGELDVHGRPIAEQHGAA